MAKAIAPTEMPPVPKGMMGWRRSLRRGSMFHLHAMGDTACGSLHLDRNNSESPRHLGDMKFWGRCPRCMKKAQVSA